MTDQQPAKPTGLHVVAALVGFVSGVWSLFSRPSNSQTLPKALLTFVCFTVSLASCAAQATQPEMNLSPSDSAICELFPLVLADFNAGFSATDAMDRHFSDIYATNQPSDQVRGVVNAYRTWVATEQNEKDKVGTYDQSVAALAAAMRAQDITCGS